ncbi:HotDog domain-containing protein [Chaetomidium leptoderma]|uniref:HotDog domain-containing protein n=1 Tax=Chaetomidium leptoderma TaxID=669021 RepID=A0AAN6ZV06_9PEZI|nr:HotDog domain-containing protein [Chaetomidium leptoderma]
MAANDEVTPALAPAAAATEAPGTQADPSSSFLAHIEHYHATRCTASPIYAFLLGTPDNNPLVRFTHARQGLFTARLRLSAQHLNSSGSIHGSVSATLVDWAGGLAIAAFDLRGKTGVSVDINVSYLSSARLGDEIEIEGRVERLGSSLAFTEVRIFKVDGSGERGAVVASGRHTKFVRDSTSTK